MSIGDMVAVMFIDLDNFKKVNDKFGHESGDQVLCEMALRLQNVVRSGDTVARMGGDEFTLIFTGVKQSDDITTITTKVQQCFKFPKCLHLWQLRCQPLSFVGQTTR